MFARIRQFVIKEFIQLWRDPRARFSLLVPPIIQVIVFGYAATFDVHNVATAILDQDHSPGKPRAYLTLRLQRLLSDE